MAITAPAYLRLQPSFEEPEIFVQQTQRSGFEDLLEGKKLRVRLAEDDLAVYIKSMNLRTTHRVAQASVNELPGVAIDLNYSSIPTYLMQARASYNHHDVAAAARWGFSAHDAYQKGLRQAIFQATRNAALYGVQPQNGEGILYAAGVTATNLPPDQFGNTTISTYDNGQIALFLANQVQQIKAATFQLGTGHDITIIGPLRTMGKLEYNIVQLTNFQRPGAGTASSIGTLRAILNDNEDKLTWSYDDTLQGAGGNANTDVVIIAMPEIAKPYGDSRINTNEAAEIMPNNMTCVTQYAATGTPVDILSPLPGGATDFLQEFRITPGFVPRSQAIAVIYVPFQ